MKKTYNAPQAVVYSTLNDSYCAELNISSAPEFAGTNLGGYGDTHAKVDGSGLID